MDIYTIIGLIAFLAVAGLLQPLRKASGVIASAVDTGANVSDRKLAEWDAQSALDHAKVVTKMYAKAEAIGEVKTTADVQKLLKSKYHTEED